MYLRLFQSSEWDPKEMFMILQQLYDRPAVLKGQCHEIFDPPFFSSIDYPKAPD
jgi:hypothetical protein